MNPRGWNHPHTPRGWFGVVLFVLILVAGWFILQFDPGTNEEDRTGNGIPQVSDPLRVTVEVDRVVDGDTARVFFQGESESVRYIGIDTPESVDPNSPVECYGEEAKRFNEDQLEAGEVSLEFGPERRDRFGRLLAYVYVRDRMLNAKLLRKGYAETLTIPPNDAKSSRFERIEAQAREAGRGLWGDCR